MGNLKDKMKHDAYLLKAKYIDSTFNMLRKDKVKLWLLKEWPIITT